MPQKWLCKVYIAPRDCSIADSPVTLISGSVTAGAFAGFFANEILSEERDAPPEYTDDLQF